MIDHGMLIISLDFELYWGVHDVKSLSQYREHLLGVHQAVPRILELFQEYDIHATWATVGKLFFRSKHQLLNSLPILKPSYDNPSFSSYRLIGQIGETDEEDPFYFAPSLIKKMTTVPFQEIGTHTFSHYYCLEAGQTSEEFEADVQKAIEIGHLNEINIQSIVFPRNQVNRNYLDICKNLGLSAYRGNEDSPIFREMSFLEHQSFYKRILRLLDAYVNVTGHHIYSIDRLATDPIINLPSSRFLRPYHPKAKIFESWRLKRITNSLTKAAKENKIYHLWWHPHNFGLNMEENLQFLTNILTHYTYLKRHYGMKSYNMAEAAAVVRKVVQQDQN